MAEVEVAGGANRRAWLCRVATYASVSVAVILISAKLAAYLATGAVSILSSLLDSSTDLMASMVIFLSVRVALRPPDVHHRFGHGKAEPLAALAQSAFVVGSSLFLSIESVSRLIDPKPLSDGLVGVWVMVVAMVLTGGLVLFQNLVVRQTGSLAIGADRLHYLSDLLMNVSVIAALVLTDLTGQTVWDSVFGLMIAALLVHGAIGIGREALDVLMDRELPDQDRAKISAIVRDHDDAHGMHDLRTRRTGGGRFIELHLELDPELRLGRAHEITDEIEASLRNAFPDAEITIHQEPVGLAEDRLDDRIASDEPVTESNYQSSQ